MRSVDTHRYEEDSDPKRYGYEAYLRVDLREQIRQCDRRITVGSRRPLIIIECCEPLQGRGNSEPDDDGGVRRCEDAGRGD